MNERELVALLEKAEGAGVSSTRFGNHPMFWKSAKGCNVYSINGEEYLDCTSSYGVMGIGYSHPAINKAIAETMDNISHTMCEIYPTVPYVKAIDKIRKAIGRSDDQVILTSSGSDAIDVALKLGYRYTGKRGVIAFENSFHGQTMGALNVTGQREFRDPFTPLLPNNVFFTSFPNCYRNPYNSEEELVAKTIDSINFLLNTQIIDGKNKGAWPEYISTSNAQTITTGHALAALRLSKDIIVDDAALAQKIQTAIDLGFQYLNNVQNVDGGWSIEPDDGNNESRAFSTIFVLRGYIRNGFYCGNTRCVREACNYLKTLRNNENGGFSKNAGEKSDTCYTARIVSILLQAKACRKKDKLVKSAMKFIFQDKTLKTLFSIKHEAYISDNSSGMVIFHSNTPIDVMEALCLCDIYDRRTKRLGKWILDTQEDNGGWYLGGTRNPEINEGVITWTTNEAIYALCCCNMAFSEYYVEKIQKRASFFTKGSLFLMAVIIGLVLYPLNLPADNAIIVWWNKIPETIRDFLSVTVLGGTLLNTFYNIIYDGLKKLIKGGGTE